MKALFKSFAILALLALSFAPGVVRAQDDDQGVSFQAFYDQLGAQGTWVQTDDYGYVFQPTIQDPNWAPYTDGHWVYTDIGWTWVSDEPWGWATYHYGRWANIDGTGWVWVPGYRWAPAWVSWRYGGGYCGWAPLPPETFVGAEYGGPRIGVGFHFGSDVDVSFHIGAGFYSFVRVGDIGEPNYRGHFIDRRTNYTIINHTTNITNINVNKTVINNNYGAAGTAGSFHGVASGGPPLAEVNAQAAHPVQTVSLTASNEPGKSTLEGNSLAVYAPHVNPATSHEAKPSVVGATIHHPTFNRGDSITKPLAVNASLKPEAATPEDIQAAHAAQLSAPASAKIATAKTPFKTTLSKPLTSLKPVTQVHKTTTATTPAIKTTNPPVIHTTANTSYTGESVKPTVKESTEMKPAVTPPPPVKPVTTTTYHPSTPPPSHPTTTSGQGGNKPPPAKSEKKPDDKNNKTSPTTP